MLYVYGRFFYYYFNQHDLRCVFVFHAPTGAKGDDKTQTPKFNCLENDEKASL